MKKWSVGMLIAVIILVGYSLYRLSGLQYYQRALYIMSGMEPEQDRIEAEATFFGTDNRGAYRGILAGYWLGRIWVCGEGGLRSFVVDNDTLYSWFDGCSA